MEHKVVTVDIQEALKTSPPQISDSQYLNDLATLEARALQDAMHYRKQEAQARADAEYQEAAARSFRYRINDIDAANKLLAETNPPAEEKEEN